MNKKTDVYRIDVVHNGQKKTYFIEKSSFVVGRQDGCDVRIEDPNISREHLKISMKDYQGFMAEDLGSSNKTYLNGSELKANLPITFNENDTLTFGNTKVTLKVAFVKASTETQEQVKKIEKEVEENPVKIELPKYLPNDSELKLEFKGVGLDLDKIQTPAEKAQAVIREAEYLKHSLLKSAEAQQHKIINDIRIKSKELADQSYKVHHEKTQQLLSDTKLQLSEMRAKTEAHLEEKKKTANEEIDQLWKDHRKAIDLDKKETLKRLEDEAFIKINLEYEKIKNDAFDLKEKTLREAEQQIQENVKKHKNQIEIDQQAADERLQIIQRETEKTELKLSEVSDELQSIREEKVNQEMLLDKLHAEIKNLNYSIEILEAKNEDLTVANSKIQEQLDSFNKIKTEAREAQAKAEDSYNAIKVQYNKLSESKHHLESQLADLEKLVNDVKQKNKLEIEAEYRLIKEKESEKLEAFKMNELQELKKIRQEHTDSLKKISLDLSQEIATKLELFSKKSPNQSFDFEKNVEIINSVIHVSTGADQEQNKKQQDQILQWKSRTHTEKKKHLAIGFACALLVYFVGGKVYDRFTKDSYQEQMQEMADVRKQRDVANQFVPEKTDTYYDDYVNATIYTNRFSEVYLDQNNQQEWAKKAIYYFVNKWKVSEEKTVQVIANSQALVQNVLTEIPNLKKDKLKQSIEKLSELEKANVEQQAKILGSQVRYEAYKKLEREFFEAKLK